MRFARFVPTALAAAGLLMIASVSQSAPTTAPVGTAVISGKILDMAGKPAAKALVSLYASGQKKMADTPAPAPKKAKAAAVATTTTDADGAFKFDKVAAGEYTVSANLKGSGRAQATISVKDGEAKDVQMTLAKKSAAAPKPAT